MIVKDSGALGGRSGMTVKDSGRLAALCVVIAAGIFLPRAWASSPLTLTYETRVTVNFQLTLRPPSGTPVVVQETLKARAGETIAFAKEIKNGGTALVTALTFIVEPAADDASCRLRIDSEVHPDSASPVRVHRDTTLASGRLLLLDIWSDPAAKERLILTSSVSWERIPQVAALRPGAEAVEILLEVMERRGDDYRSLESNRLASIVGSKVAYSFQQQPGLVDAAEGAQEPSQQLVIEILPESITDGRVFLRVRLRREHAADGENGPAIDTTVSEKLPPGFSLDLPLAGRAGDNALVFRITPYF